jgi:hypothetical protein
MSEDSKSSIEGHVPVAWHRRPIPTGTVVAILEAVLYYATGLNMPWWFTCFILFLMWALLATVAIRSEWTVNRPWIAKGTLCVGAALFVITLGAKTVREGWNQARSGTPAPDVTLKFVYPKNPALLLINQSAVVARDIHYEVALWDLDTLSERTDPLPMPSQNVDWIRPHSSAGPQNLFFTQLVRPLVKPGDRLIGSAAVSCADCVHGHTFIVYIEWNNGGWVWEATGLDNGQQVRGVDGELIIPKKFTKAAIERYADDLLRKNPNRVRVSIGEP